MKIDGQIEKLQKILESHKDKRVVVVGTTCTGKSTFVQEIKDAKDMDNLIFPLLTKKEKDCVCSSPWTPEIGKTMTRLVREKVKIEKGKPVFGTVLIDSDLIIYLKISDELLGKRTHLREARFEDAKNMQKHIEEEIKESGKPIVEFFIC